MYLLNAATTIEWDIQKTVSPPALGDLDLIFIDPAGGVTYVDAPLTVDQYTAPTETTNGSILYDFTPQLEGFWRIRLVVGTPSSYHIISKVEMYVFDSTTVTTPYNDDIGKPAPYDVNYYLQGFVVPGEIYGTFVASRTITFAQNAPSSRAICETFANFFPLTLNILHNTVKVGEVNFATESYVGVITIDPIVVSIGDKLQIQVGLGVADEYISDIAINLVGCCTVVPCTVL